METDGCVVIVAERMSNFCLAHKLIWPLWSRRIFSPNRDDLSHSAQMTFSSNAMAVKARETPSSSAYFRVGQTSPFFLFSSRSHHHEKGTSNLWTFVSRTSILHHSFNPPRPTASIWIRCLNPPLTTAIRFLFWFSNSTFVWLRQVNSCYDIQLLYSFPTTSQLVFSFLRLTAQRGLLSQAAIKTSKLKTININTFVLPFNITRGDRTLQPQLSFLYKR